MLSPMMSAFRSVAVRSNCSLLFTSRRASMRLICWMSPMLSANLRYAGTVTMNAGGTGIPALTKSPRLAPFPPASATSPRPTSPMETRILGEELSATILVFSG